MEFGAQLHERLKELHKLKEEIPAILMKVQTNATIMAIEKATEVTPPNEKNLRGTSAITGTAKSHWSSDSDPNSKRDSDRYITTIGNNVDYISYLDEGHRMDMHFVPGLIVNPYSGLLEKVDPSIGGIMVGTKTKYVQGLKIKEAYKKEYQEYLEEGIQQELRSRYNE